MHKTISSLSSESSYCSISFLEALISLITVLVSSSFDCTALRDVGLMPTFLPLLKYLDPLHIRLVTTIVHVLEAFMDYSNLTAISFKDLRGLDKTIACLKLEVYHFEGRVKKRSGDSQSGFKGNTDSSI